MSWKRTKIKNPHKHFIFFLSNYFIVMRMHENLNHLYFQLFLWVCLKRYYFVRDWNSLGLFWCVGSPLTSTGRMISFKTSWSTCSDLLMFWVRLVPRYKPCLLRFPYLFLWSKKTRKLTIDLSWVFNRGSCFVWFEKVI